VTLALGAVALAVAGAAYGVEEFELVAFSVVVLFATGLLVTWSRSFDARRSLVVGIRVPVSEVVVGHPATAELTVTNTGTRTTGPVQLEDPGRRWSLSHPGFSGLSGTRVPSVPSTGTAVAGDLRRFLGEKMKLGDPVRLPGLRTGEQAVVVLPVPTSARGLLTLSPLGVWCEDPLRLFAWKVAAGPPTHVLVCPSPERAPTGPASDPVGGASRPYDSDEHEAAQTQGGDEFRSLRPYVPGDRMTRLHWPSISRTGELTVRDFVEPASGCVTILVDLRSSVHESELSDEPIAFGPRPPGRSSPSTRRSVEAVISRAAGLGLRALDRGRVVELCTSAGERVEIPPGPSAGHDLLCALAVLGPTSGSHAGANRWMQGSAQSAVWAATHTDLADILLVTTRPGETSALPDALAARAERVVVG